MIFETQYLNFKIKKNYEEKMYVLKNIFKFTNSHSKGFISFQSKKIFRIKCLQSPRDSVATFKN